MKDSPLPTPPSTNTSTSIVVIIKPSATCRRYENASFFERWTDKTHLRHRRKTPNGRRCTDVLIFPSISVSCLMNLESKQSEDTRLSKLFLPKMAFSKSAATMDNLPLFTTTPALDRELWVVICGHCSGRTVYNVYLICEVSPQSLDQNLAWSELNRRSSNERKIAWDYPMVERFVAAFVVGLFCATNPIPLIILFFLFSLPFRLHEEWLVRGSKVGSCAGMLWTR